MSLMKSSGLEDAHAAYAAEAGEIGARVAARRKGTRAAGAPIERPPSAGRKRRVAHSSRLDAIAPASTDGARGTGRRKRARMAANDREDESSSPPHALATTSAAASLHPVPGASLLTPVHHAASSAASQPIVLVKIGADGHDSNFDLPYGSLQGMRCMALLEQLATSVRFSVKLKDVSPYDCTVWLLPRVAGDEPTRAEESAAVELEGADTIGDVLTEQKWTPSRLLFLRVRLPGEAARLPLTATRDECVAAMCTRWRTAVSSLQAARTVFSPSAVPMLHLATAHVKEADAVALKLTQLYVEPVTNKVQLGVFDIPELASNIVVGPKGFSLHQHGPFFLQEQRMQLSHEFVDAMKADETTFQQFGVLLSGPNGVGKSAVGVQTFITCFARGLLVVYIPSAHEWMEAAACGKGDEFFIEQLLRQNADLIADLPVLRSALAPVLFGDAHHSACMEALMAAMKTLPRRPIGVIVDEVQHISQVGPSHPAASYFSKWKIWDTAARYIVRMDISSSNGVRERRIPSGEEHRLRIIKPWSAHTVYAATTHEKSPVAFKAVHESARQRVVFTAGGIPRSLFNGNRLLHDKLKTLSMERAIITVETELKSTMEECCERWFRSLTPEQQLEAAQSMLALVRGEVRWERVKDLCDTGLVARLTEAARVSPVSPIAASVIALQIAGYMRTTFVSLSSLKANDARGLELERQVLACLMRKRQLSLPASTLDGSVAPNVQVARENVIFFKSLAEVVCRSDEATLYVPLSPRFACDAISTPAANSDPGLPIVIWETSVTDPREPERVTKCLKWFDTGSVNNLVQPLQERGRPLVCALCWPNTVTAGQRSKYKDLTSKAAEASLGPTVKFAVVGLQGLQALGVLE